jgi:hypothetical protein
MENAITIIVLIGLGIYCVVKARSEEMGTILGFGTKLYGHKETENGEIKTKWVTLLFLPVFPLKSYEVFEQETSLENITTYKTSYRLKELPKMYKPQVIPLVIVIWPILALIIISAIAQGFAPQ